MAEEYNQSSERSYNAPEAPLIVESESSIPKIPKWVKISILSLALSYLAINFGGFFQAGALRSGGISKSEIEEKIDKSLLNDKGDLVKFVLDDLPKPGRELAYLILGDGE